MSLSKPSPYSRVLLVYKKSNLDLYIHERKNTRYQALMEADAVAVKHMQAAHDVHQDTLTTVKKCLAQRKIPTRVSYRARFKPEDTGDALIITVGGDGTVLDASHKISQGTILGVNSAPGYSAGFLCAAQASTFSEILDLVLSKQMEPISVPRLKGSVDGNTFPFPVLNDILITQKTPAATARYLIQSTNGWEEQKSSGICACVTAGSTAAIASAGGQVQDLDDPRLQILVREPYDQNPFALTTRHLFVEPSATLEIISKMREGVIFLDGPHQKVSFPVGAQLSLSAQGPPVFLMVTPAMKERRQLNKES